MDRGLTSSGTDEIISRFWSVWQEQRDKLYNCCLRLMNFNPTEAEDALSRAQLKAWEKVQEYADKIKNLKAWLMELTRNLCLDIIDECSRGPAAIENIEWVGDNGLLCTVSSVTSPQMVLEMEERYVQIRRAVASLPQRLRDTFVLHFYEELKHAEIAERQGISYNNVCKRISLARQQLETTLRGYFRDEEALATALDPALQKSPATQARVEKRQLQFTEEKGKENVTVSAGKECAPVVAEAQPESVCCAADQNVLVGCDLKEVGDRSAGRSSEPTPQNIVEKQTRLSDDSQVSASVSAASAIAPVAVDEKPSDVGGVVPPLVIVEQKLSDAPVVVDEKPSDVAGVVHPLVIVEQKLSDAPVDEKPSDVAGVVDPLVIVEQKLSDTAVDEKPSDVRTVVPPLIIVEQKLSDAPVDEKPSDVRTVVPPLVIVEQKLSEVSTQLDARSHWSNPVVSGEKLFSSPLGWETATVSAAPERVPVAVEAKQDKYCCAVDQKNIIGQNIKEVSSNGSARSHWSTPLGIVEKLSFQFGEELYQETVTVSAARGSPPVDAGEKLSFVSGAVAKWALIGEKIKEVVEGLRAIANAFAASYSRKAGTVKSKTPSTMQQAFEPLLNLIAQGESQGSPNAMNQGTIDGQIVNSTFDSQTIIGVQLTTLTVAELMKRQAYEMDVNDPQQNDYGVFAAGQFQFIPSTLKNLVVSSGIADTALFDVNTQNFLCLELIRTSVGAAYRYLQGESDDLDGAINGLASQWASLPTTSGGTAYAGTGNAASHSIDSVRQVLQEVRDRVLNQSEKSSTITTEQSSAGGGGSSASKVYVIQAGDTLSGIASRFGVPLGTLEAANPQIANPNLITPGESLHIPES